MQGFRKIDTDAWQFANANFIKGKPDLLSKIQRHKPESQAQGRERKMQPLQPTPSMEVHTPTPRPAPVSPIFPPREKSSSPASPTSAPTHTPRAAYVHKSAACERLTAVRVGPPRAASSCARRDTEGRWRVTLRHSPIFLMGRAPPQPRRDINPPVMFASHWWRQ